MPLPALLIPLLGGAALGGAIDAGLQRLLHPDRPLAWGSVALAAGLGLIPGGVYAGTTARLVQPAAQRAGQALQVHHKALARAMPDPAKRPEEALAATRSWADYLIASEREARAGLVRGAASAAASPGALLPEGQRLVEDGRALQAERARRLAPRPVSKGLTGALGGD